jgi:hypothetical protein
MSGSDFCYEPCITQINIDQGPERHDAMVPPARCPARYIMMYQAPRNRKYHLTADYMLREAAG